MFDGAVFDGAVFDGAVFDGAAFDGAVVGEKFIDELLESPGCIRAFRLALE